MNKVFLIGRLGRDPEIRYTNDNRAVANMQVATSEKYKDASGQLQEKTEWHRVVVFSKIAEAIGKHLSKGSQVSVEGQLATRKWTDKNGVEKYTTEVIVNMKGSVEFLSNDKPAEKQEDYGDGAPF